MSQNEMLAGVFIREGVLEVQSRPVPTIPADDWVLINMEGCGVCGSDLHALAVPPAVAAVPDTILGHEIIGNVVEIGSAVSTINVGDRVTVAANLTCGLCRYCKAGMPLHCENWTTLGFHKDGGFAGFMTAPERALYKVSKSLPFEEAVWIEPLSCVVTATDKLAIQPGQVAAVIGAGPIGILFGMMFKAAGAKVIIADLAPVRLEMAKKAGLDVAVNVKTDSLEDVVAAETGDWMAEAVVDAVGTQLGTAVKLVAKQGKVASFGLNESATPSINQYTITRNELTVAGTFVGEYTFPRAIQILESGVIKPSVLNNVFPLSDILTGIHAAHSGEIVKAIVTAD